MVVRPHKGGSKLNKDSKGAEAEALHRKVTAFQAKETAHTKSLRWARSVCGRKRPTAGAEYLRKVKDKCQVLHGGGDSENVVLCRPV